MKNKLKSFRKSVGATQKDIAAICNVAQNTISNWETGRQSISIQHISEIAVFYGVGLYDIVYPLGYDDSLPVGVQQLYDSIIADLNNYLPFDDLDIVITKLDNIIDLLFSRFDNGGLYYV